MFDWGDNGNKVFWFISSERDGRPGVKYPDGTEHWPSLRDYNLDPDWDFDKRNAYIRENLFMTEYNIWDITAFGASMSIPFSLKNEYTDLTYVFATASHADEKIYPYLDQEQIEFCKDNVRMFYNDPNLQAGWPTFILYPVTLILEKDGSLTPIYIGDIGSSETVVHNFEYEPIDYSVFRKAED